LAARGSKPEVAGRFTWRPGDLTPEPRPGCVAVRGKDGKIHYEPLHEPAPETDDGEDEREPQTGDLVIQLDSQGRPMIYTMPAKGLNAAKQG
jgi:hypothetical protein